MVSFRHLTLIHLPKNHLISRASLRFSEMLRKIMAVCCGAWIASHDRLRAEGEVPDFSRGETPRALAWRLSCRRSPPVYRAPGTFRVLRNSSSVSPRNPATISGLDTPLTRPSFSRQKKLAP